MRRCFFIGAVLVLAIASTGCDWPTIDFGPQRTGFNSTETAISPANVGQLHEAWRTSVGSGPPAVAGGKLFVVNTGSFEGGTPGYVRAFDAAGKLNCANNPKVCSPLWTATFPGGDGAAENTAPAVANGVVYVGTEFGLLAFDAAGTVGCSGTPTTCKPLWSTSGYAAFSPLVSNGVVYVGSEAFDAAGATNCSNTTPRTCRPLWIEQTSGGIRAPEAEANGILYIATQADSDSLYAFDAKGVRNCSPATVNAPRNCSPLWRGHRRFSGGLLSAPVISNGIVYVGDETITAFDAAGIANCSGTPKTCSPLWDTPALNASFNGPAVAYGNVYGTYYSGSLYTFDAAGISGCSGTPKACTPLWSARLSFSTVSSASIANGVVYATAESTLYAFDAAGVRNCSGAPKTCTPLWTAPGYLWSPIIANGVVYENYGGNVHAYTLP